MKKPRKVVEEREPTIRELLRERFPDEFKTVAKLLQARISKAPVQPPENIKKRDAGFTGDVYTSLDLCKARKIQQNYDIPDSRRLNPAPLTYSPVAVLHTAPVRTISPITKDVTRQLPKFAASPASYESHPPPARIKIKKGFTMKPSHYELRGKKELRKAAKLPSPDSYAIQSEAGVAFSFPKQEPKEDAFETPAPGQYNFIEVRNNKGRRLEENGSQLLFPKFMKCAW